MHMPVKTIRQEKHYCTILYKNVMTDHWLFYGIFNVSQVTLIECTTSYAVI